ncbi:MAG TPA: UTP--glucose-1-phosphate uridylyltransferase [Kofleriaceae bacterium]|jgi:UTP--glucose-1-phosphate uridylyltransferase
MKTLAEAQAQLGRFGFDSAQHAVFRERAAQATASNAVTSELSPLRPGTIEVMPPLGSLEREKLRVEGLALIRAGQVGIVVLAGGMATRFGGVVKAVVPALDDRSFLEWKVADARAIADEAGGHVPVLVMSSFATHAVIEQHVAAKALGHVDIFPQAVDLRLTPTGELFTDKDGELSPYATGHGDLPAALRASGALDRFRKRGGTTLLMSNVDNLAATLDPAVIALHVQLGGALTAEVVKKDPGDKGGAPALYDGRPQIIEGFRFPASFDQDSIDVFNTNTFTLDAATLDRAFELPYYRVEKQVHGAPAIQFEHLVGELTAYVPSRFIQVSRVGAESRFLPAKDPDELERNRPAIAAVLGRR